MKKFRKWMSGSVVFMCSLVASVSLYNTCFWIFHQSQEPQELLEKLEK